LRDLTRCRKVQIEERTREIQRLEKVLREAGFKLSSVASQVLGISGRVILEALIDGTANPEVLAEVARGRLRSKIRGEPLMTISGRNATHPKLRLMVAAGLESQV
jgi:transposase